MNLLEHVEKSYGKLEKRTFLGQSFTTTESNDQSFAIEYPGFPISEFETLTSMKRACLHT